MKKFVGIRWIRIVGVISFSLAFIQQAKSKDPRAVARDNLLILQQQAHDKIILEMQEKEAREKAAETTAHGYKPDPVAALHRQKRLEKEKNDALKEKQKKEDALQLQKKEEETSLGGATLRAEQYASIGKKRKEAEKVKTQEESLLAGVLLKPESFNAKRDGQKIANANRKRILGDIQFRGEFAKTIQESWSKKLRNVFFNAWVFGRPGGVDRYTTTQKETILNELSKRNDYLRMEKMLNDSKDESFKYSIVNQEHVIRASLRGEYASAEFALKKSQEMLTKLNNSSLEKQEKDIYVAQAHNLAAEAHKLHFDSVSMLLRRRELETAQGVKELAAHPLMSTQASRPLQKQTSKDLAHERRIELLAGMPASKLSEVELMKLQQDSLKEMQKNYDKAFNANHDTAYASRTALTNFLLGKEAEAQKFAEISHLTALRDGGREASSPFVHQAEALAHVIQSRGALDHGAFTQSIAALKSRDINGQVTKELNEMLLSMEKKCSPEVLADARKIIAETAAAESKKVASGQGFGRSAEELKTVTYNYRGETSHSLPGNFAFSAEAILYGQRVNREDHIIAQHLNGTRLKNLLSPERIAELEKQTGVKNLGGKSFNTLSEAQCLKALDFFVRDCFRNDARQMENLQSPGHLVYDSAVKKTFNLAGIGDVATRKKMDQTVGKTTPLSSTNITMALMTGMGDCRHHAQSKQLLFDVWQKTKVDQEIKNILNAKTEEKAAEANQRAREILETELRTADISIHSRIALDKDATGAPLMYKVEGAAVGHDRYLSPEINKIEEHTMNFLVKKDKVELADSFYHKDYVFNKGELNLSKTEAIESTVQGWKQDDKGKWTIPYKQTLGAEPGKPLFVVPVGQVEVVNKENGKTEKIEVYLEPTAYAGKRSTHLSAEGRQDQGLYFLGQKIAPTTLLSEKGVAQGNAQRAEILKNFSHERRDKTDAMLMDVQKNYVPIN